MKHLYGAAINGELIAVHDFKDIVENFIEEYNDRSESSEHAKLVKLVKARDDMFNKYNDLYLVRYGDKYIQSKYYSTNLRMTSESLYDIKYARDVLLKILEYRSKGAKSIEKVLLILEEEASEIEKELISRPSVLEEINFLNNSYKERVLK